MTRTKSTFLALLAVLLSPMAANADPITVGYDSTSPDGLFGSFSGTDTNNDGLLTFGELDSWTANFGCGSGGCDLSFLNDLGDFDYVANSWIANGLQWDQITEDAYMTWNNWASSASTSNATWGFVTTVSSATSVPEPGTLALFGIGLFGMGLARRKKV